MNSHKIVQKALKHWPTGPGNRSAMARSLGVDPPNVFNWLHNHRVDPRYCVAIEVLGGGIVTAHQLRPDVFPEGRFYNVPRHPNKTNGRKYQDAGDN